MTILVFVLDTYIATGYLIYSIVSLFRLWRGMRHMGCLRGLQMIFGWPWTIVRMWRERHEQSN